MSKPSPFKKIFESREEPQPGTEQSPEPTAKNDSELPAQQPTQKPQARKRGRPATGKRSDDAWIGRTYYVKRETDLDVEEELLKLRRQGIDIDKSELVDFLMAAWMKWRKGENIDFLIDEFSPRRNFELD